MTYFFYAIIMPVIGYLIIDLFRPQGERKRHGEAIHVPLGLILEVLVPCTRLRKKERHDL